MNKFYKVSRNQFYNDILNTFCSPIAPDILDRMYEDIKLPKRATKYSAGYDFYAPFTFRLESGKSIKFPTGIRVELDDDRFLMCVPRSGLGFKYRMQLDNTIGIIDSDYFFADNEGHIFAKFTNDNNEGKAITVARGEAFMQGIILKYGITEDDCADGIRTGGLGSTSVPPLQ